MSDAVIQRLAIRKDHHMAVSQQLRQAIERSGLTHYRLGILANVDSRVIDRFISGERATIRSDTLDRLCKALGLELRTR